MAALFGSPVFAKAMKVSLIRRATSCASGPVPVIDVGWWQLSKARAMSKE